MVVEAIVGTRVRCWVWGWGCCWGLRNNISGMSGLMVGRVMALGSEVVSETVGGVVTLCWNCVP